ncbi:MAG: aldehyde dehydrogenase family protein, partial [Gaiellaceae bacterium]
MARAAQTKELRSVNPATLEPVGSVPVSAPEEVAEAVSDARLAAGRWAESSFAERRALLGRVAAAVLDSADEIAATVTAETGKPLLEAYTAELFVALDNLVWAAANAPRVLRPERLRFPQPHLRHKRGFSLYEPLGVIAVISPWNFPFGIPFTQAAFAVAAGNVVVVKPSELAPLTGAWLERLFPDGLVRVVQGGAETGEALVRAPGTAKVAFTGSGATGRRVAALAGERLRPVTLELGGKDPMLVFEDADLDRAVDGALWGAFSNCGQVCSGVERIYVARPLLEPFVEELARRSR